MKIKLSKPAVAAIRAMERGEATPEQQITAMSYIVKIISDRESMSFASGVDGDRLTAFAEGRRFVGNQIVHLVITPMEKLFPKGNKNV